MYGFTCPTCGQYHDVIPLNYGADTPDAWYDIDPSQRHQRAVCSSDQCIIDDQFFFVRGNIELPIIKSDQVFSWSVWVSLSERNFQRAVDLWEQDGREAERPYFGWLNTRLPGYPNTINLKTLMYTLPVGQRPHIVVEPTEHPLAIEQQQGITWERIYAITEMLLHDRDQEPETRKKSLP
jgi:hypothetical protein